MIQKIECPNCRMEIAYLSYEYSQKAGFSSFSCPVCGEDIAFTVDEADLFLCPDLQYTDRYRH